MVATVIRSFCPIRLRWYPSAADSPPAVSVNPALLQRQEVRKRGNMGDINKTTTKKEKKRLTETGRNCPSTREREREQKKNAKKHPLLLICIVVAVVVVRLISLSQSCLISGKALLHCLEKDRHRFNSLALIFITDKSLGHILGVHTHSHTHRHTQTHTPRYRSKGRLQSVNP